MSNGERRVQEIVRFSSDHSSPPIRLPIRLSTSQIQFLLSGPPPEPVLCTNIKHQRTTAPFVPAIYTGNSITCATLRSPLHSTILIKTSPAALDLSAFDGIRCMMKWIWRGWVGILSFSAIRVLLFLKPNYPLALSEQIPGQYDGSGLGVGYPDRRRAIISSNIGVLYPTRDFLFPPPLPSVYIAYLQKFPQITFPYPAPSYMYVIYTRKTNLSI